MYVVTAALEKSQKETAKSERVLATSFPLTSMVTLPAIGTEKQGVESRPGKKSFLSLSPFFQLIFTLSPPPPSLPLLNFFTRPSLVIFQSIFESV